MAEKIKVLLVDTSDIVGGIEIAHVLLLRSLDRTRFDVYLACLDHGPMLPMFQNVSNVTIWPIESGTRPPNWREGWKGCVANIFSIVPLILSTMHLACLCRRAGIQVIHTANKKRSLLLTLLLHWITRKPYIFHIHGVCENSFIHRSALVAATVVVANSTASRGTYLEQFGLAMERIRVLHNGIDAEHFRPGLPSGFRDEIGATPDDVVIGIANRLAQNKGQDTFMNVAAFVARLEPRARFVVVGDDSPDAEDADYIRILKRRVGELGLAGRLTFAGFRSNMAAVYTGLDVLVNPTLWEGFGLVMVEAMACGKVAVGTDAGGIPEIITHGRDGFLFPPCDEKKLTEILLDVVRNPELRKTIGVAARKTVLERFTIQRLVRDIENLYTEIAK